jgi:hypothetical protein
MLDLLGQANEDLKHRNEWRQGGRFLVSYEYEDAEQGPTARLGGGTKAPQFPLPVLVATYMLMGRATGARIEELFEALHPGVLSQEVREKVREVVESEKAKDGKDGLKALARQLAGLVRGEAVDKGGRRSAGAPRPAIPAADFYLGCSITERREAEVPDEQIYEGLRRLTRPTGSKELTRKEFRRLADLGLRWPWS